MTNNFYNETHFYAGEVKFHRSDGVDVNSTLSMPWRMGVDESDSNRLYILNSAVNPIGVKMNTGGGWGSVSDLRIKFNINKISSSLNCILNLNPVTFLFKDESLDTPPHVGFIAQEVEKIFPSIISNMYYSQEFKDNIKGITITELIPYLVKSIQEQQIQIESLKSDISDIKSQLQK